MTRDFAPDRKYFLYLAKLSLKVGAGCGASLGGAGVLAGVGWDKAALGALVMFVGVILMFALVAAVVSALSIRVTGTTVQQLVFRRFAVSEYPISDFLCIVEYPQALRFSYQRRMNLAGMHPETLAELDQHLRNIQH